jgi:trk system potassium uptake protein TrkA
MKVVIMGCGRTGSALAVRLQGEGDAVAVIDPDRTAEGRLPPSFSGRFLLGSGVSRRVLEDAGIADAEAFVALSHQDSANAVATRVARDVFRVPRVLARLHDPAHAAVYAELGITTVGSVATTVNRVLQLLHHAPLEPHQTFGNGETVLVRSEIPDYLAGRKAFELNVEGEIQVVELSRKGHSRIPLGATLLEHGDVVSFVVASGSLGRLRSFLGEGWM